MFITQPDQFSDQTLDYLVDEQEISFLSQFHPASLAWEGTEIPDGAEELVIDLGKTYYLKQLALHNLYSTTGIDILTGTPGDWKFKDALDNPNFMCWNFYELKDTTRYICFKWSQTSVISINELVLSGFEIGRTLDDQINLNTLATTDQENSIPQFGRNLTGDTFNPMAGIVEDAETEDPLRSFTFDIYTLEGEKVYSGKGPCLISMHVLNDVSQEVFGPGVFILHYYNQMGVSKKLKFLKLN